MRGPWINQIYIIILKIIFLKKISKYNKLIIINILIHLILIKEIYF
jgi:hypothetical protein